MTAIGISLYIEQGATWNLTFVWAYKGPDDPLTGEVTAGPPRNITGASAKMQIREYVDGPVALEASTTNGKIVITGSTGTIAITLSDADTSSLAIASGGYDLEVTLSGVTYRLLEGTVKVSPNWTR